MPRGMHQSPQIAYYPKTKPKSTSSVPLLPEERLGEVGGPLIRSLFKIRKLPHLTSPSKGEGPKRKNPDAMVGAWL